MVLELDPLLPGCHCERILMLESACILLEGVEKLGIFRTTGGPSPLLAISASSRIVPLIWHFTWRG